MICFRSNGRWNAAISRRGWGKIRNADLRIGKNLIYHPPRAEEFGAPPPHAILFDPHSPKKNPAMWTAIVCRFVPPA